MLRNLTDLYSSVLEKEDVDSIMTEYIRELRSCRDWIEWFQKDYRNANSTDTVNVSNLLASMPKLSKRINNGKNS